MHQPALGTPYIENRKQHGCYDLAQANMQPCNLVKSGAFARRDLARRRFVGEYAKGTKARAVADLKKVRLLVVQLREVDLRAATCWTAI